MRRLAILALCAATGALAPKAAAQSAKDSPSERERTALFKEGRVLSDQGRWSEAAERFRRVVALRSAPKALVALAFAEEHLGHLLEARRLYEAALRDAQALRLPEEEQLATQGLRLLVPRIARLSVTLPSDAGDAQLLVDGASVAPRSGDVEVDPGEHRLEARAAGRRPFQTTARVSEGGRAEVRSARPRLRAREAAVGARKPPPPGSSAVRTAGFVAGGGGLAAVAASVVFGAVALAKKNELDRTCPIPDRCTSDGVSTAEAGQAAATVSTIIFVVGASSLGLGITLVLASDPPTPATAGGKPPALLRGLSVRGAF